jgi:hypothetical protein
VTDPDCRMYDVEFSRVLRLSYNLVRCPIHPYTPGTFTGTWDGSYMVSLRFVGIPLCSCET